MDFLIYGDLFPTASRGDKSNTQSRDKSDCFKGVGEIVYIANALDKFKEVTAPSMPGAPGKIASSEWVSSGSRRTKDYNLGRVRDQFQDVSELDSRLWEESDRRMSSRSSSGRICIMGFHASDSDSMIEYMQRSALSAGAFSASIHDILDIATVHETVSTLVVNGDAFGDLISVVDALKNFREIRPSMSVVLVSSKVANDDLSADRKAICDATLRAPITMTRLHAAVDATLANKAESSNTANTEVPPAGGKLLSFRRSTRPQLG